jgi:hypothetical protein
MAAPDPEPVKQLSDFIYLFIYYLVELEFDNSLIE